MLIGGYTLISVIIVSLISFVGAFTLAFRKNILEKMLLFFVSLSAGALFGDAFLHLLPEAVEKNGFGMSVGLLIIAGIVLFFILEKYVHWHHCHHGQAHCHKEHNTKIIAIMNLAGDGVHNFIDGLVIAASYLVSIPVGIATTIAVVLHEVPQEIADFGVLLYGGLSVKKALLFNFLSATLAILGAIIGLWIGTGSENFVSWILPFTAGGFIYIAGADLIPELHKENSIKASLFHFTALLLGIGIMVGLKVVG